MLSFCGLLEEYATLATGFSMACTLAQKSLITPEKVECPSVPSIAKIMAFSGRQKGGT